MAKITLWCVKTIAFRGEGTSYGETDDFGFEAVKDKVHLHDLHATILHLMGLDHECLTYFHQGRNERLTDVFGNVVEGVIA